MKQEKCCFCEKPITAGGLEGFSQKLKERMACTPCAVNYLQLKENFGKWSPAQSIQPAIDVNRLTESAQQNSLFGDEAYSTIRIGDSEWRVTGRGAGYRARLRLKDNLEHCACTHKAGRHVDDGQGNLLHCRDCDCDHFWYAVPAPHYSRALVVLSEVIDQSAEATKIAKLRSITRENGATAEEEATALRRILDLTMRQAA